MEAYGRIMAQARRPAFYQQYRVPDSFDGRFDLLVLHVCLFMFRAEAEGRAGKAFNQGLFDFMFADMDRTLREMGIGDLGVAKRMKKLIQAFYGRMKAYREALASPEELPLLQALDRNLYGTLSMDEAHLKLMASYVRLLEKNFAAQSGADLLSGRITMMDPVA
jgi:cytochrome b pre-mRNA-processing protein 3